MFDFEGLHDVPIGPPDTEDVLPFEEARTFVRTLKLRSAKEWGEYSKSGKRPFNIPSAPHTMYRDTGWVSTPDWLGYKGQKKTKESFLSFEAARNFVRTLKLGSQKEWYEYNKSSKRPSNIPSHPHTMYRDTGWVSMSDWLGYEGKKKIARWWQKESFLSFEAARNFARTLKLAGWKEWNAYRKSGKRPSNIPSGPDQVYCDAGWVSMPDWLGYEEKVVATGSFLSFEAARTFVRSLKLRSGKEWKEYSKNGKRPSNIPGSPQTVYRDAGWVSIPDWLGYGIGKQQKKGMARGGALSFEAARTFVRTLKLSGWKEWTEYSKSGKRPSNIPSAPAKMYRDAGWVSMPDWLGYEGKEVMANGGALSFEAARTFVRTLKLGSHKEWREYSKSGKRPSNIPGNPSTTYRDAGWISLPDWLGYGVGKQQKKTMTQGGALSFEAARTFVRTLKMGSVKEWKEYSKSGKRPSNIPGGPAKVYRDAGWVSLPDWLGYEGRKKMAKRGALPFEAARTFVRQAAAAAVGAASMVANEAGGAEWSNFCAARALTNFSTSHAAAAADGAASGAATEAAAMGGGSTEGPSRKRARPSSGSDSDSDDDILSNSSGPPQTKVKVEEVGGFSIVSAASDLSHTACGLLQHGAPTS